MTYKINFEANPAPEDIQVLGDGIIEYAVQRKNHKPMAFFAFFIRDENNKIQGGCNCAMLYGCLYIDSLWLTESLRHQKWGTQLMSSAEKYGKEQGCTFACVNTMDWEALDFYKKLNYKIEFERHGFEKNSVFYFLRKELIN